MAATWTKLERQDVSCASASHGEHVTATWRMDAGEVGSYFCDDCRKKIADALKPEPAAAIVITERDGKQYAGPLPKFER